MVNKLSLTIVLILLAVILIPIYHAYAAPTIVMSDTTATFGALISAPRQFIGELANPTSVLVGKQIDSITIKLQKVGAPIGIAQVGVFDVNRNVVKLFGTIDVSTISTTATDYEFKLLSTDPLYTIQSDNRIGFMYTGGSATVGVNVTPDRDAADPFDGANSYRVRYETAWINLPTEDMYMILQQTRDATSLPGISINDILLTESNSGTKNFNFTVTRSGNTTGTSSVNFTTSDGTATISNSDYVSKSGQLVFAPGQTTKTVTVLVNGDTVVEPTETFNVNLSSCVGCTIADNLGVGTIQDDDSPTSSPTIVMSDTATSFGSLISTPRQFVGEFASPTSVLVGKQIDSITLSLSKAGAPTGLAQVGIFDTNRNVVKLFGTIDVSTIIIPYQNYEFKLSSPDLYTIQSGDRIGFKYIGGDATNGINVMVDRSTTGAFDGANSYRVRYEAAWISSTTEDMTMILQKTGGSTPLLPILLNPTSGPAGTTVNISGNGFDAGSNMKIQFDNTKIAFGSDRNGDYEIYTMNADGTGQNRLTNAAHDDINPSFSPNGTKIAFESGRDGHTQIYIMNSNGSAQTRLTNNGAFDLSPSFSPNGTKIVFHTVRDGNNEIYIMNTDGSAQTRLTNNAASDRHPVFSPDGSKIVFSSDRDGNDEIYIMNANGTGQARLTNNAADDILPTFSPDGTKIAFSSNRDGNYEIYIMNTNGSGQTRLTNNAATDLAPSFSPDGNNIAFHTDRDVNNEIYVMNVNGSGQTPLSNNLSSDTSPSFSSISTTVTTNPASITINSTGGFSATFSVPTSTGGIHTVSASDAASHLGSKTFSVPLPASISINPTAGSIASSVTVTGTQYAANSHVTIKYDNTVATTNPSSITSSGTGAFSATFTVPSSTVGAHIINASDAASHFSSRLYAVNSQAAISLNPTTGPTGSTVTVKGTQYDPNSQITIKYDSTTVTTNPTSVTTNTTGGFSATFSVPSSTTGAHTVSASDAALHSDSKPFTVTGSGSGTFHMQTVLSGFNQPVKLTFIPDNGYGVDGSGNAFVSERVGKVQVMKYTNGQFVKQSVPFVTVPNVFSSFYEEGLAGIAFPPDYNTSHFVYFYAAVQFANGTHVIQVMRYTVTTDASQNIVAVPGSQKIILAFNDLGIGHFGGHIKFDSSGNLYIGAGDQWTGGASASLQTLKGKLLRITPLATPDINGKYYSIPSTNPFASSSDSTVMKEIFSYGLRHPYSFDIDSVTGKLYVDDVGLDTCEEIDDSTVAKNFGWGVYEGPVVGNPQNLVNYKNPTYYYYHADVEAPGGGFVAITAGAFYNGNVYPSQYDGAYFFGDYGVGFIKALLPVESYPPVMDPATGVLKGQVVPITSGHPNNPVGLAVWHGEVYYTDYNGNVGKLTFS